MCACIAFRVVCVDCSRRFNIVRRKFRINLVERESDCHSSSTYGVRSGGRLFASARIVIVRNALCVLFHRFCISHFPLTHSGGGGGSWGAGGGGGGARHVSSPGSSSPSSPYGSLTHAQANQCSASFVRSSFGWIFYKFDNDCVTIVHRPRRRCRRRHRPQRRRQPRSLRLRRRRL